MNKCLLFSHSGLFKDRWPHADFFPVVFPIAFVCNMNCVSRLPWEQHFSALQYRAVEEGEGLGLFARRGHAGVSLYNPINAGTGSNGVHVPTKAPSGHKLSPCKGSWRHLGGEKRQIFNGECLPHHVLEPASAPGNQSTQRNIQQ